MSRNAGVEVNNVYDVLVVGAGMAGLTSACYLAKAGLRVLVCERAEKPGGLVADFTRHGYHFDAGLRAIENSGIIFPMLRGLGIELEFLPNPVSIRVGDKIVRLEEGEDEEKLLDEYAAMLTSVFPQNENDIRAILGEVRKVMSMMDVLYGIDNPLFMDMKSDPKYLLHTILPWLFRYQANMRKMKNYQLPIEQHLSKLTDSQALIDVIAQHFFRNTPGFFALGYFSLYMDYKYPKDGTGALTKALTDYLKKQNGELECGIEITGLDPALREATAADGRKIKYKQLIWAADMKALYRAVGSTIGMDGSYQAQAELVEKGRGGDSVLSVFFELDLEPAEVAKAFGPHCFYTPLTTGLSSLGLDSWKDAVKDTNEASKAALENWIRRYLTLTTFEISCPVLRQSTLAPKSRTGLIVSTLFDIDLVREIDRAGWYPQFKDLCVQEILLQMENALPGIKERMLDFLCSSPLTIQRHSANADGAITGWAFDSTIPAESRFTKIAKSIQTPIPNVYQAGQWTFSPSGLPISVLTGKLASDAVIKKLKKKKS